jgi:hypothetical protein
VAESIAAPIYPVHELYRSFLKHVFTSCYAPDNMELSVVLVWIAVCIASWEPQRFQNLSRPIITFVILGSILFAMTSPELAIEGKRSNNRIVDFATARRLSRERRGP